MKHWVFLAAVATCCASAYAKDVWLCKDEYGKKSYVNEAALNSECSKVAMPAKPPAKKKVAKQGVHIGMTQEEAIKSSWGKPERVNRTTRRSGVHEQWVYGGRNYLYFENGILTTIQN
jgi:hypothetical protein